MGVVNGGSNVGNASSNGENAAKSVNHVHTDWCVCECGCQYRNQTQMPYAIQSHAVIIHNDAVAIARYDAQRTRSCASLTVIVPLIHPECIVDTKVRKESSTGKKIVIGPTGRWTLSIENKV